MKFQKGQPRLPNAGRKKGTPNKKTLALTEICEEEGLDVFRAMVKLAMEIKDPFAKFKALSSLAEYLHPKRKAVEHINENEEGFRVILEDYTSKNGSK